MKFFILILACAFFLVSCSEKDNHGHDHSGHDHDHSGHNHDHGDHEGHDHGDHEGHDHEPEEVKDAVKQSGPEEVK